MEPGERHPDYIEVRNWYASCDLRPSQFNSACPLFFTVALMLITASFISPGSLFEKTALSLVVIFGGWIVLAVASGYRCYVAQSFVK